MLFSKDKGSRPPSYKMVQHIHDVWLVVDTKRKKVFGESSGQSGDRKGQEESKENSKEVRNSKPLTLIY